MRAVNLVPDTNIFEQCVPLATADWSTWSDCDEVNVLVTRPAIREIDRHKNRGSDRISDKARAVSKLFNEILDSGKLSKVIRESRPRVTLHLRQDVKPTKDLDERLDYDVFDDHLVGCAHALSSEQTPCYLLTGDAGPKASAIMVGILIAAPPSSWKLSAENDEREKENARLKQELARYKRAEPQFAVKAIDRQDLEVKQITGEVKRFDPLTLTEIDEAMALLQSLHPKATDFGSKTPQQRPLLVTGLAHMRMGETFVPATDRDIVKYSDEDYPEWLKISRQRLSGIHQVLQKAEVPPEFIWILQNIGTRPAEDALVTFLSKGTFLVRPPPPPLDEDEEDEAKQVGALAPPPRAPSGHWRNQLSELIGIGTAARFAGIGQAVRIEHLMPPRIRPRDKNAFYPEPGRPSMPGREFALQCQQWRHGADAEHFVGQLFGLDDHNEMTGDLVCRIMAANATDVIEKSIKVRINVRREQTMKHVERILLSLR
jgi:hypothetical protein